jgi:hypothetical protein
MFIALHDFDIVMQEKNAHAALLELQCNSILQTKVTFGCQSFILTQNLITLNLKTDSNSKTSVIFM